MEEQFYRQLVQRYIAKKLNDDELEVFIHLMNENKLDRYLLEAMNNDPELEDPAFAEPHRHARIIGLPIKVAAAAAILLIFGFGLYFYKQTQQSFSESIATKTNIKIVPGGNKAILTLADGKKIVLNNQKEGELSRQNKTTITKVKDGLLIYDNKQISFGRPDLDVAIAYNTIQTPRGGQYQIVLPDGSKAWLNASSSIRFPIVFADKERQVEITGEVYFEVAHNKEKPFRVVSQNQLIEVQVSMFAYQI